VINLKFLKKETRQIGFINHIILIEYNVGKY
jgi:hypothetical protein